MTKFNAHSFLFAFIVLIFVAIGNRGSYEGSRVNSASIASRTSLAESSAPFGVTSIASSVPTPTTPWYDSSEITKAAVEVLEKKAGVFPAPRDTCGKHPCT
jgi:hypothetical protein